MQQKAKAESWGMPTGIVLELISPWGQRGEQAE